MTRQETTVSERTRAALERDKALVLRSIKELEFDRSMGKLSQKDFDEMAGRLRARALMLMKQLDAGTADYTSCHRGRVVPADPDGVVRGRMPAAHACGCGTANDADAVFCKKCGQRIHA